MEIPRVHYAKSGDFNIAYQVVGEGEPTIVLLRAPFNHLELQWEEPRLSRFLLRLASIGRLVVYDARGFGLSDPLDPPRIPPLEEWADDTLAILDEVGCERAAVVGIGGAVRRALPLAASHPERVTALVLCNPSATAWRDIDRTKLDGDQIDRGPLMDDIARIVESRHGRDEGRVDYPWTWSDDLRAWVARYERNAASPRVAAMLARNAQLEGAVRHIIPAVRVPTLVLVNEGEDTSGGPQLTGLDADDSRTPVMQGRRLAELIEGAKFASVPGTADLNGWLFEEPDSVADEIERFVTGANPPPRIDRVLATVLFTDIVGSTEQSAKLGDERWRRLLDDLDSLVASEVSRSRGRVVKSTGDGHLATFDGPGRAIGCACALRELAVGRLGLRLRSGLHTGEIELRGDDIGGIAVSIGRRVCDLAAPNKVVVSSSVPPLVVGSGIGFVNCGPHELKGVPGTWDLYEVV